MAIVDIGKNIVITRMYDGSVLNFFNHTVLGSGGNIVFRDIDNKPRYIMSLDQTVIQNKYRCAHFTRSFAQSEMDVTPKMVIMLYDEDNISSEQNISVTPLYEFISPSIMCNKQDTVQLTWWSNIQADKFDSEEEYNVESLIRFSSKQLQLDTNIISYKIMCTATIRWEMLKQVGGGVTEQYHKLFPIISKPSIITIVKDQGYVLDFESGTGSGGGGIGLHSHTSNDDGGFAAAVFMPSARIRPLNWR